MTRPVLVLATRNEGKRSELAPMVEAAGFRPVALDEAGIAASADEDALESFDTFEENAIAKARYFFALAGGPAVLADDSGLAVEALGGAPGVRSKRWSSDLRDAMHPSARDQARVPTRSTDEENNRALLDALRSTRDRRAKFVCVAAIAWSGGSISGRGEVTGVILDREHGTHGFGYDPLFCCDDLAKTFAEATREEKSRVSHRARAVRSVLADWNAATHAVRA